MKKKKRWRAGFTVDFSERPFKKTRLYGGTSRAFPPLTNPEIRGRRAKPGGLEAVAQVPCWMVLLVVVVVLGCYTGGVE